MNKAGGASATRGTPLEPSPRPARTHQGTAGAPDLSRAQRIFHKSPARQVTSLGDARHAGAGGCLTGTSLDASLRSYGMRRTVFGPIARFKDASPVAVSQERCNNRHGAPSGWEPLFAAHPRREGRRMGEEKRRSSVRRKEPFAPLSSSAAPPVSRSGGRSSTRAGGTGSGAFGKKRASPTLFAFGVREEASLRVRGGLSAAACCRALDTAALCPYISWKAVLLGSAGMFYGAGLRAGRAVAANLARTAQAEKPSTFGAQSSDQ